MEHSVNNFIGLWKRLLHREHSLPLNDYLKAVIWKIICKNQDFQFFELTKPRRELEIINQFDNIDSLGITLEMVKVIYFSNQILKFLF